jgi:biotin carboxyl carrier protein
MLAAAVFVFVRISGGRVTQAARIDLTTVTLTAQAIPVESALAGQVTAVSVTAQQRVRQGDKLGVIEVTTTNSQGKAVVTERTLTAPHAGIAVDEPVPVGATLQPGLPFVELYDPSKLTFVTDVKLPSVSDLAPGMVAELKADGLSRTVEATVQRIVPNVGTDASAGKVAAGALRVVLVPTSAKEVTGLVPGLRFTGTVDTRTGDPDRAKFVSMPGRPGHAAPLVWGVQFSPCAGGSVAAGSRSAVPRTLRRAAPEGCGTAGVRAI